MTETKTGVPNPENKPSEDVYAAAKRKVMESGPKTAEEIAEIVQDLKEDQLNQAKRKKR